MRRLLKRVAVWVIGLMVLTGCNPSPYLPPPPTASAWPDAGRRGAESRRRRNF
jgi:hypothetical protein